MRTAIVTGGAGFLGSHLCAHLLRQNYNVICIDDLSSGLRQNISPLEGEKFLFLKENVCDLPVHRELKIPRPWLDSLQYVFHFASPASPPQFLKRPLETLQVNSVGLQHMLDLATKYSARLIFASTSEIYGLPTVPIQSEDYYGNVNSWGERACYNEGKRFGEALIYSYNKSKRTQHGVVRIFNTYGPGMNLDDGRVVIEMFRRALLNEAFVIRGDGSQTRSFCYVDDLIQGIISYAKSTLAIPLNIGNPEEISVLKLAEKIQALFPANDKKIVFEEMWADEPLQRRPDITRAIKELNWRPETSLEDGLQKMKTWLESSL